MGNGRYSVDLDYGQWFTFNNWQRVHYNFLEQLTPTLIWIFISALYKPLVAAIFGFLYFFGRIFYSIGYFKSPNQRIVGALIIDIAFLGSFILSLVAIGNI